MRCALGNNAVFGSNYGLRASAWREMSGSVPRDDTEIHDDLDLSFRLPSTATVIHDSQLIVGVSGRPFQSLSGLARRWRRAVHTIAIHWPEQSPTSRWRSRWKVRRRSGIRPPDKSPDAPIQGQYRPLG